MNRKALVGLGVLGLGLAGLAASRRSSANDGRIDPPTGPGGEEPGRIDPPVEPPPTLPPGNVKNYVGSGWQWSGALKQAFPQPVSIGMALFGLGYPVNFANDGDTPSTQPFNMISAHNMTIVREFQRDYNVAAKAQTVDASPSPASLDDDGLVANLTMRAILNAQRWARELGLQWADVVALA